MAEANSIGASAPMLSRAVAADLNPFVSPVGTHDTLSSIACRLQSLSDALSDEGLALLTDIIAGALLYEEASLLAAEEASKGRGSIY